MNFRDLRADEIEVRVQQCKENGVSLLLYKDARCDMNILDEVVGPQNWQRSHEVINGNLYCNVSIYIEFPIECQWVTKQDCGTESNTEKEKGEASDSFKRACVNWGIGRELYTAPFIWVKAEGCNIKDTGKKDNYGKPIYKCNDKFKVEAIKIVNKKIVGLSIVNESNNLRVFTLVPPKEGDKK